MLCPSLRFLEIQRQAWALVSRGLGHRNALQDFNIGHIALKFGRRHCSTAAKTPINIRIIMKVWINASRLSKLNSLDVIDGSMSAAWWPQDRLMIHRYECWLYIRLMYETDPEWHRELPNQGFDFILETWKYFLCIGMFVSCPNYSSNSVRLLTSLTPPARKLYFALDILSSIYRRQNLSNFHRDTVESEHRFEARENIQPLKINFSLVSIIFLSVQFNIHSFTTDPT